jgi:hypothetical protein
VAVVSGGAEERWRQWTRSAAMVRGEGRVAEIMPPSLLPRLIKQGWTT